MLAGLVARGELEDPQRLPGRRGIADPAQGIEGQLPTRGLGAEKEDLVDAGDRRGLEHREQRADGLADAGGRLGHQAPAPGGGAIDRFGEHTLAGTEIGMNEPQLAQSRIPSPTVGHLATRPFQEGTALGLEELLERRGVDVLDQYRLLAARHVEVDQRDPQPVERQLLAHEPAVHPGLRPVQMAMIGGHGGEVAAMGLDLLELLKLRVVAVRPAPHAQRAEGAGEADLGLVMRRSPGGYQLMTGDAFLRARRGREAQVQVARARGELAQAAHGDDVLVRRSIRVRGIPVRGIRAGRGRLGRIRSRRLVIGWRRDASCLRRDRGTGRLGHCCMHAQHVSSGRSVLPNRAEAGRAGVGYSQAIPTTKTETRNEDERD